MAYSATALKAVREGLRLAIPDGELTTSKWAETYRHVDRGARKGKWSNATTPYLVEIMDCDDDPAIREIVVQKPSQWGGSEAVLNVIGKRIHLAPTEILYCAEKEDKAKAWTQESFDATVRATPVLKSLIYTTAQDNNQNVKRFPGGGLYILWATSPEELSSRPAELLIFDEKAAFKPTREGDAVAIGEARIKTYSGSEKIFKISSPRLADDDSDISHDYERGDQREYYVPCPSCDELQTLKWKNVKWDADDPESAFMVCEYCGVMIEDDDKYDMLLKGKWVAHAPFNGIASFKSNQLYSNFVPWARMVVDFLAARKFKSKLQVWTNTEMGEPWKPEEQVEYADLTFRQEEYDARVPQFVLVLTAGIDIQKDRIECEVTGWGFDHECWSIEYKVFEGDPAGNDIWDELSDYLTGDFQGVSSVFRIKTVCIDSGYLKNQVYRFCKANAGRKWFAIKGVGGPFVPMLSKPTWSGQNPKCRLFAIGTNAAKDEIFGALKVAEPGPGFCHFPKHAFYDDAYFKQLCSEKRVKHFRLGQPYFTYEVVSKNIRNEALDCRVYATAARAILNPNYEAIARNRIRQAEVADRETEEVPSSEFRVPSEEPKPTPPKSRVLPFKVKNNPFEGYRV